MTLVSRKVAVARTILVARTYCLFIPGMPGETLQFFVDTASSSLLAFSLARCSCALPCFSLLCRLGTGDVSSGRYNRGDYGDTSVRQATMGLPGRPPCPIFQHIMRCCCFRGDTSKLPLNTMGTHYINDHRVGVLFEGFDEIAFFVELAGVGKCVLALFVEQA